MAVNLSFIGGAGWQFFDDNGDPLSGGKIYTYAAGTTTPQVTYTSRSGNTPNTNPIILDAAGRTPQQIWSTEGVLYKYVIKTSADVTVRTWDDIGGSVVASDLGQDLANTTNDAKGDALIGFRQSNTSGFLANATARTVNSKLQETVSVFDFMTTAQIADVQAGTLLLDVSTALQNALTYVSAKKSRLYIPAGKYAFGTTLYFDPTQIYDVFGDGYDIEGNTGTVLRYTGSSQGLNIANTIPPTKQDKFISLSKFALVGSAAASDGIFANEVAGLRTSQLLIRDFGGNGMNLSRVYNSQHTSNVITGCGQSGIRLYQQGNNVLFDRCIVNGNSKSDGYSNINLSGTLGRENLGVTLIACDFTGAGEAPYTTVTTAYGLTMTYCYSVNVIGCYSENNKTANVYADLTNKNVNVIGCYFQDADHVFINIDNLVIEGNTFFGNNKPTPLSVTGQSNNIRRGLRLGRNTYLGLATQNFSQFARERQEQYGTSAPVGGTYEQGDIVWRFNPDYPYNIGWVCSVGGTPGTWIPFAQIPAVYTDHGDASVVLQQYVSYTTNMWQSPITATRTVTFSNTNATVGTRFRIVRTAAATGAFNLNVVYATGTKALTPGTWCDVEFDGSFWFLTAAGSL